MCLCLRALKTSLAAEFWTFWMAGRRPAVTPHSSQEIPFFMSRLLCTPAIGSTPKTGDGEVMLNVLRCQLTY